MWKSGTWKSESQITKFPHLQTFSHGARSEIDAKLADDGAFEDVAEDVLLDLLVADVGRLDRRRQPVVQPFHTEPALDHRVGLGRAVERLVEDVLPERAVGVGDDEVAQIAALVEV